MLKVKENKDKNILIFRIKDISKLNLIENNLSIEIYNFNNQMVISKQLQLIDYQLLTDYIKVNFNTNEVQLLSGQYYISLVYNLPNKSISIFKGILNVLSDLIYNTDNNNTNIELYKYD